MKPVSCRLVLFIVELFEAACVDDNLFHEIITFGMEKTCLISILKAQIIFMKWVGGLDLSLKS